MTDIRTTKISLTFTDMMGETRPLGSGTIDEHGHIEVDKPAKGQEDFVTGIIDEINARDNVVLKGPPASSDGPKFGITKRKVPRGDDEFLSALIDYAKRLYGLALVFDMAAIGPESPDEPELAEAEDFGSGQDPEDVPESADDETEEVNSQSIDI